MSELTTLNHDLKQFRQFYLADPIGATVSHLSLLLPAHFVQRTVAQFIYITALEAEIAGYLKELGYE